MNRGLIAALSIALTTCAADDTTHVDTHLRKTFSRSNGLRYEQRLSRPRRIDAPTLARILPQTHFYRATLRTADFEYPEVQILIAERRRDSAATFTYRLSPTFSDDQSEFLATFSGASVPASEREQVAISIADLFATITYAGRVGAVSTDASTITVELWHDKLMWRHIVVHFTPSNTIESVHLTPKQ